MDMVKLVGLVNFQEICIYLLGHGSGQHVQLVSSGPTSFRTCHNFIFTCPRSSPVRLEPAAPRSRVKHSTSEPLRSLIIFDNYCEFFFFFVK